MAAWRSGVKSNGLWGVTVQFARTFSSPNTPFVREFRHRIHRGASSGL